MTSPADTDMITSQADHDAEPDLTGRATQANIIVDNDAIARPHRPQSPMRPSKRKTSTHRDHSSTITGTRSDSSSQGRTRVLYADEFESIQPGHHQIVTTAASHFDEVILLVTPNSAAAASALLLARAAQVEEAFGLVSNVSVVICDRPVGEYAQGEGVDFIVEGPHGYQTAEMAIHRAALNLQMHNVATLFIPTLPDQWATNSHY